VTCGRDPVPATLRLVSTPELLVIKAVSPTPQKLEQETYVAHARVHSGHWTSAMYFKGTSELKMFLKNNLVNTEEIDSLIRQLAITRNIILSNVDDHIRLMRYLNVGTNHQPTFEDIMWT